MIAIGHSAERRTVCVLDGPVRGPNTVRKPERIESGCHDRTVHRRGGRGRQAGQKVSVEGPCRCRDTPAVEASRRGNRCCAVADAPPHDPSARGAGVDDGGRRGRYALRPDDRIVRNTQQEHVDLEGLRSFGLRLRAS